VGEHATQEGTYVALTRAREQTHLYAAIDELDPADGQTHLGALAEQMSRSEQEIASIDTRLAHEQTIETEHHLEHDHPQRRHVNVQEPEPEHDLGWEL